jgi:hypothetical protein
MLRRGRCCEGEERYWDGEEDAEKGKKMLKRGKR